MGELVSRTICCRRSAGAWQTPRCFARLFFTLKIVINLSFITDDSILMLHLRLSAINWLISHSRSVLDILTRSYRARAQAHRPGRLKTELSSETNSLLTVQSSTQTLPTLLNFIIFLVALS